MGRYSTAEPPGLVVRWQAAFEQLDSHRAGCTCEPCRTARAFIGRIRDVLNPPSDYRAVDE